jgi:alkaline phosphatase D
LISILKKIMKIAFTSCCDPWNDPIQTAWTHLAAKKPDVLILLGDNMYMDYGLGKNPYGLNQPHTLMLPVFAKKMYENYEKQWAIPSFQKAIQQIPAIHAIWDDHDFAWNNGRGEGKVCTCVNLKTCKCEYVSPVHRMISKTLFEQFRNALITKPTATSYPNNPYQYGVQRDITGLPYTGIEQTLTLTHGINLHLLDGRSFRPDADTHLSLLGSAQQRVLTTKLNDENSIHIIASGTTLKDWHRYNDYAWLQTQSKNSKIIVLSGDIHTPDIRKHHDEQVFEFTASAMAQPARITGIIGKESNIFGILDIQDEQIKVDIWQNDRLRESAVLDRESWLMTYQLGILGKFLARFK